MLRSFTYLVGALTLGGEEDEGSEFAEGGEELFVIGGTSDPLFGQGLNDGAIGLPFGMSDALRGGGSFYGQ